MNEKATILYIDDQNNYAEFQKSFQQFYDICTAQTALEAINILHKKPIAIIIANQSLPGFNGISFFESILTEFPDSIRILMADANDADLMIEAINTAHVFRYITKPLNEDELKQSIDVGIKIYNLEKTNREYINQMHEESIKLERILNLLRKSTPGFAVGDVFAKKTESLFNGELVKVTILFISLNNINDLVEEFEPQIVLDYLNNYFSTISHCIEEHKGFVDKLTDGIIIGIFGAPIPYLNNENNALFCALDLVESFKKLNAEFNKKMNFEAKISMGVHSGEAIVGNVGSDQYVSYAAIGDVISTASELTNLGEKEASNSILISPTVYDETKDTFIIEPYELKEKKVDQFTSLYKVINKKS